MSTNSPTPLIFAAREARLADLDALPRPLWLGSMINSQGGVEARLAGLRQLAQSLLLGVVPPPTEWPDDALATPLVDTLRRLQLDAFCADKPELGQQVVSSLLWHLDHVVDYQDRGKSRHDAIALTLADFADDWSERCGMVSELAEILGDLGDLPRDTQWGELKGLLKSDAWQEVVRIRRLLERLPELARLIRRLGRSEISDAIDLSTVRTREITEHTLAPVSAPRPVRVPDLPGETRGICRSGRFARMLPAETLLLCHPRLRLVWHARHAERALLTYEDDDRDDEVCHGTAPLEIAATHREPDRRREMGPMLICVDTSGSMQGGAEAVAKACALEAARTAHAQGRDCYLFAFGGPDEVVETSLKLDAKGIRALTEFLGQGFRGGTDICAPIERAIDRLHQEQWQLADLVIASDGSFGATPEVAARLHQAKQSLGVRVQAVLIADRETIGLLELADDVFWVRDWRRYGGGSTGNTGHAANANADGNSPVQTKSMTADYFPGALRKPGTTTPSLSPAESARALWPKKPS